MSLEAGVGLWVLVWVSEFRRLEGSDAGSSPGPGLGVPEAGSSEGPRRLGPDPGSSELDGAWLDFVPILYISTLSYTTGAGFIRTRES